MEDVAAWVEGQLASMPSASEERRVAVFDADGTLWADDLGERHLEVLEGEGLVRASATHDSLLAEYEARCAVDVDEGYGWAVTCMAGLTVAEVRRTSAEAWRLHHGLVPQVMEEVIDALHSRGIEVWIVSASHRWAIEGAARSLGVLPSRVIAMEVEVVDDRLSDRLQRPLPNGAGKVERIRERIGVRPCLAFGNSRHDLEMLEHASSAVVVRVAGEDGELPAPCSVLGSAPRTHGWATLDLFAQPSGVRATRGAQS